MRLGSHSTRAFWAALGGSAVLVAGLVGCECPPRARVVRAEPRPAPQRADCVRVALPTGDPNTSVLWLEKCGPARASVNTPFEYVIRVTNRGDGIALRDVRVLDSLPGPFQVQGGDGARGASGEFAYPVGDLRPGETKEVIVRGVATDAGILANCATATYTITACLETEVVAPQLALRVNAPDEALICEPIQPVPINVMVRNTGTGEATNVRVNVLLPAEMRSAEGPTSFDVGTLHEGETREFTLMAAPTQTGVYVVAARALADGNLAADATDLRITARAADLTLVAEGPAEEYVGLPVEYTISVTNKGNAADENVIIESVLPEGVEFLEATNGGQRVDGRVVWRLGALPPQGTHQAAFRVRPVMADQPIRNTISVSGACGGTEAVTLRTNLVGVPAMLVEVVDTQDPNRLGAPEDYLITVTNQGSADLTNVIVMAQLPPEIEFVRGAGPTPPQAPGEAGIQFAPLPVLHPKQSATWTVTGRCLQPGDIRFRVNVTSDQVRDPPVMETEATRIFD